MLAHMVSGRNFDYQQYILVHSSGKFFFLEVFHKRVLLYRGCYMKLYEAENTILIEPAGRYSVCRL